MPLELKIDLTGFDKKVKNALVLKLNGKMKKVSALATKRVQNRFKDLIEGSPTVQSLYSGELRGEIGLINPGPKARIQTIIEEWIGGLIVTNKPPRVTQRGISGGFKLQMVKKDWSEVLNSNRNTDLFITPEKGHYELEWLRWLLIEGSKRVVKEFHYEESTTRRSRTRRGIMVKGKFWTYPSQFESF